MKISVLGETLNGESKDFSANGSDLHVSDDQFPEFSDNVNSAMCVCLQDDLPVYEGSGSNSLPVYTGRR